MANRATLFMLKILEILTRRSEKDNKYMLAKSNFCKVRLTSHQNELCVTT